MGRREMLDLLVQSMQEEHLENKKAHTVRIHPREATLDHWPIGRGCWHRQHANPLDLFLGWLAGCLPAWLAGWLAG